MNPLPSAPPVVFTALALIACTATEPARPASRPAAADPFPAIGASHAPPAAPAGWSGEVRQVDTGPGGRGLEIRGPGAGAPVIATGGDPVPAGASLRTDERSRAVVTLSDGATLRINHSTEVQLRAGVERTLRVTAGHVIVDVPHRASPATGVAPRAVSPAVVEVPTGRVILRGTKVSVVAEPADALVTVTRGVVDVSTSTGDRLEVHPGEEAHLPKGEAPRLLATSDLSRAAGWDDGDAAVAQVHRGLGSLTAREPGGHLHLEAPLRKAEQTIRVRIRGTMAYTEVTEAFQNDSGRTLEGTYRFPLPDDAQISRLALLVHGRWQEGQIVENQRAERIWRQVIAQWRDPAWLRWRHGSQFELRIFPIEPHSTRKITIGYTQSLRATADGRRYVYPMPVDRARTQPVDQFGFEARIYGAGGERPIRVTGYSPVIGRADDGAATVRYDATGFAAAGDLAIELSTPPDRHLTATAFRDPLHPGEAGFAVITLRPRLPRESEVGARDLVIVADTSYSRTGVAAELQAQLVRHLVAEMDPLDRVALLACNERCRPVGAAGFQWPSAAEARKLAEELAEQIPSGATNVHEAVRVAAELLRRRPVDQRQRRGRILYLTDGIASAGPLEPAHLASGTRAALGGLGARLTVADLGGDQDAPALAAVAAAGGGSVVHLTPGASLPAQALRLLGHQYGAVLVDGALKLPAGLEQVYPRQIPPLAAGDELRVVARVRGAPSGEMSLRGRIGDRPFEERQPLTLKSSTSAGNAFAAQLWAQARIRALEREDAATHRREIVALSRRFGVLSRYTSLLALESTWMRREFAVDAVARTDWDGEEAQEESEPRSAAQPVRKARSHPRAKPGAARRAPPRRTADARRSRSTPAHTAQPFPSAGDGFEKRPASGPAPVGTRGGYASADDLLDASAAVGRGGRSSPKSAEIAAPRRYRRYVRRLHANVRADRGPDTRDDARVERRRRAANADPTSPTRRKTLIRALSLAERLPEAEAEAAGWLKTNPMDAEALTLSAEIAVRLGEPERAERLLASAADAAPRARWIRRRLVGAYTALGDEALTCAHRVSLETIEAARRGRGLRLDPLACPMASDLSWLGITPPTLAPTGLGPRGRDALRVELSWDGPADLDVGVLPPSGRYTAWLGGHRGSQARGVAGRAPEWLTVGSMEEGRWKIDVVRRDHGAGIVRGRVVVRALGRSRTFPFALSGRHQTVARVNVGW